MPPPEQIRIESRNTGFYVISTDKDNAGQQVDTRDGRTIIPDNSVRAYLPHFLVVLTPYLSCLGQLLFVNPGIYGPVTIAVITGITGLYVALEVSLHIASLALLLNSNWKKGYCREHQTYLVRSAIPLGHPSDWGWLADLLVSHSMD
jgi:hypothetical protein